MYNDLKQYLFHNLIGDVSGGERGEHRRLGGLP